MHGVLTGDAVKKINKSKIKKFVISNSILNDKKLVDQPNFKLSMWALYLLRQLNVSLYQNLYQNCLNRPFL